jgi:hemolysin activation/secretion protein
MRARDLILAVVLSSAGALGLPGTTRADAGASTFAGARKLYRAPDPESLPVWIPPVEAEKAPSVPDYGPGQAELRFAVDRFDVVGNTLLPASEVEAVLAPYQGADRTLADVETARNALQKAYDRAGFVTVAVVLPQQNIVGGVVSLRVVEARVGNVTVKNEGVDWFGEPGVRRDTPHLVPGATLREEDLDADIAVANRNPDRRVQPVLRAGQDEGTVDLDLVVDDRIPLHGEFSVTNERTPGSPVMRADTNLSYTNLWGLGHEIGGSYEFVPGSQFGDVQVWTGTYRMPMPWEGEQSLFGYVVHSDTASEIVGATGLNATGNGLTAGLRYDVPLPTIPGWEAYSHGIVVAIDRKDVTNVLEAGDVSQETPITYLPWGFAYRGSRYGDQTITALRLGSTFNVAGTLQGGGKKNFQENRGGVDPDSPVTGTFAVLTMDLSETVRIPALLRTIAAGHPLDLPRPEQGFVDDWTLDTRVRGQWASQPLVSTEQCAAGGPYTVRGYLVAEAFGDGCFVVQTEVHAPAIHLPGPVEAWFQPFVFFDYAKLWVQSVPDVPASESVLSSFGVGLHAEVLHTLNADLYLAKPRFATTSSEQTPKLRFRAWVGF